MKHTNDVEEGQNVNTLSEIEEYYKAREQQLLKKLHQQGAALAAAEQALKQLTENQKVSEDETARQRAAREQAFEEKLYRDPLTGIYNRRYYEEVARKTIGPAGVALMDVDDFKICNDTYGHYAGDMALKTVANTIQSCIRKSDLLIRYGGDEFLLVLPGIPGDFLQTKLEQICTAAQMASVPGYSHFRISLSIGGTIQSLADPMENIVRRADRLMYQAKCRKNAVMVEVPGHNLAALEKLLQNKPQILLVDDSAMNRMILTEILGDSYHILEAENGRECMEKLQAEAGNIALVLLDINMPVMDGFEVLKAMNANHTIEDIPVIMISSEDSDATIRRSYELGASDYVNRPFDARIVYRRVTNTIKLYAKQRRLVQMVSEQIRARENNTDTLVGVLSHIVEFRNGESGAHVRHIRIITELLLRRLLEISSRYSITAEQQDMIPLASALHDIGKIGIDEKVLNKPGKLTLTLNLTKRDGGVQSSYQPIVIDNALAQHHYKFNFDVNAGSATVNITFTDRTETVTHTIDVSDGTMRIDPPFFILNGFTSNTALDIKEGKEADHSLSLYLNARSGIEECILTTSSSSLISQGWPAYIDLADLSTDKLQLLQSFGLQLKGLGANKDKIATIDFTNVIPHIEYDNGVLSTFKLVAKDKLKKVNKEEVILAINSLSNQFAVVSPEALPSGSTYIDLVVTLDGKPETIKASCILYGASQDLKCGLLSTEGDGITHHIRVTFPVKITSSTQMTVTCGRKKATFTLSVN